MTQCVQGLDDFGRPALSDVFNVFGFYRVAQRAVLFYMRRRLSWELRLRSGSKPPARQGHFVVTTELPEIQTVTVWTPCCVPMNAILKKKNLIEKPPVRFLSEGCSDTEDTASVARCKITAIFRSLVLYQ